MTTRPDELLTPAQAAAVLGVARQNVAVIAAAAAVDLGRARRGRRVRYLKSRLVQIARVRAAARAAAANARLDLAQVGSYDAIFASLEIEGARADMERAAAAAAPRDPAAVALRELVRRGGR